ncbi:hypothetical protein [Rhodococcus qingshengii]|uniref:hypothetical protein n=1 Tax=Rhodococcus qingshengii TaxID=334542 RepID=UPI001ADFB4DA|nr:hypothetical protein [Rhodococcus qingshengii]
MIGNHPTIVSIPTAHRPADREWGTPPEDLYADPYDAGATVDVYEDVPPAPDPAGWDALIPSEPRDR